MNNHESLFRRAIVRLGGNDERILTNGGAVFARWLAEQRVPKQIADFLVANSLSRSIPIADENGEVMPPDTIIKRNTEDPSMLRDGFLQIASAMNGDPIVVDLLKGDGCVGFLSHDELWGPDPPGVREVFAPVAVSIADFLYGIAFDEDFPIDFYATKGMGKLYEAPPAIQR